MTEKFGEYGDKVGSVVRFAEMRLSRGFKKRPCPHKTLIYCTTERQIECSDCLEIVDPFSVFVMLVNNHDRAMSDLNHKRERFAELARKNLRRVVTRFIDKMWQGRKAPPCPHCQTPLLPEDFDYNNPRWTSFEFARKSAEKRKKEVGT